MQKPSYTDQILSRNCSRATVAKLFCQCKWGDTIILAICLQLSQAMKIIIGIEPRTVPMKLGLELRLRPFSIQYPFATFLVPVCNYLVNSISHQPLIIFNNKCDQLGRLCFFFCPNENWRNNFFAKVGSKVCQMLNKAS